MEDLRGVVVFFCVDGWFFGWLLFVLFGVLARFLFCFSPLLFLLVLDYCIGWDFAWVGYGLFILVLGVFSWLFPDLLSFCCSRSFSLVFSP